MSTNSRSASAMTSILQYWLQPASTGVDLKYRLVIWPSSPNMLRSFSVPNFEIARRMVLTVCSFVRHNLFPGKQKILFLCCNFAGYKEINLRGMKLLKPGGFLVTSSCTNLVQPDVFYQTIEMAAKDAKRNLRQVVFQSQSADHPIIRGLENTNYLKFLIVQVL